MRSIDKDDKGVFFALDDYAGMWRRFAAISIDLIILIILTAAAVLFFEYTRDIVSTPRPIIMLTLFGIWYAYLVVTKRLMETLGYKLMGIEILDLRGNQPSLLLMSFRSLFYFIGPMNLLFDIFWIGGDPNRQGIRDKFSGTYVVKKGSTPLGVGRVKYVTYYVWGYMLMFREVARGDN